jgi:hypothetical protein
MTSNPIGCRTGRRDRNAASAEGAVGQWGSESPN